MKTYYVYVLECVDKSYYTWVTNDLERRYTEHILGKHYGSYTFWKRPVKLVYFEEFRNIELAIMREKQIKGWTRKKKEYLINHDYDWLSEVDPS